MAHIEPDRQGRFGLAIASLGEPEARAGPRAYEEPPVPVDARTWALWGTLILTVLLLLWMAWRLIGETRTPPGR